MTSAPNPAPSPTHVGLIPDGTRRWAATNEVELERAYDLAFKRVAVILERLWSTQVGAVSVYMLSRRNLGRRKDELDAVFAAEAHICQTAFLHAATAFDARVVVVGDLDAVPMYYAEALRELANTRRHGSRRLYLLVAYDPMSEIGNHALSLAEPGPKPLAGLPVPEPLDLVIRTSGVHSLSDFLPLQAAYAELRFVSCMINELTNDEVDRVLLEYTYAERRRGL